MGGIDLNKKVFYKVVVGIISIILIFFVYQYFRIKNAKIEVYLVDDLTIEFNTEKKVSDFIVSMNGKILDDYQIPSQKLGKECITFHFINDQNIKVKYTFTVEVVDKVKPLIWLGSRYHVVKDSDVNLLDVILCGDNYDANPKCLIEGNYDIHTIGDYPLVFKATDQSGNTSEKSFILNVYDPLPSSGSTTQLQYIDFTDIVEKYRNEKNQIGIDVSSWQGDIDFEEIKKAGVEFIIIRVGSKGADGEYFLDKKFKRNIELANQYHIPVGVYFYSYADSILGAREDARWVLKQIEDYKIDLPIAFDWEEWKNFNHYHLSFFGLTSMAEAFLEEVEKAGYKGMLYSSKTYLENIWFQINYDIWLAHYTEQTNYEGNYRFWQMTSSGKIDGIDGAIDVDIYYP